MMTRWFFIFLTLSGGGVFLQETSIFAEESTVYSSSSVAKSSSPLQQPQMSLLHGGGRNGWFRYKNLGSDALEIKGDTRDTQIFEVDLELHGGRGFNIGMNGRFESGKAFLTQVDTLNGYQSPLSGTVAVFRTSIGGFVRGQYLLTSHLGLFVKGEVGMGPYLQGLAGFAIDGVAQVGLDFYFTDWWGVTVSYGYMSSYGIETAASRTDEYKKAFGSKPLFFTAGENLMLIGLKSTYL